MPPGPVVELSITFPNRHVEMKNKDNTWFPCFLARFLWLEGGFGTSPEMPKAEHHLEKKTEFKIFNTFV